MTPSGSSADLAVACLHSFTCGQTYPEPDQDVFRFGNAAHDVSEHYIERGRADLPAIVKARGLGVADARRLDAVADEVVVVIEDLAAAGWLLFAEVPLAYDPLTGVARILASRGHRDYLAATPSELTGTLDIVGVKHGAVLVRDIKTSRTRRLYDGVSWQLRLGAVALAKLLGADEVHAALLYVGEEGTYTDGAILDELDLVEAAATLRALMQRVQQGPTPPVAGTWCVDHYCRALGHCAATRAALAEVASSGLVRVATPDDAARVWEMLPHAEKALEAAKAEVMAMALRSPIPLPGGRRLVVQQVTQERIGRLTPRAEQMVREAGAAEALDSTTSAAAIKRCLAKPAAMQLLADLRNEGCLKTSTYDKACVVKEKETGT